MKKKHEFGDKKISKEFVGSKNQKKCYYKTEIIQVIK